MTETKKKTIKKEEIKLDPTIWSVPMNEDLIAQVLYVYFSNERKGTANAKTRGEVSGGGKKPWRQKGTGRARQGSIRSPLWIKGGVTFVPNNRNWKRKINKKMKNKAMCMLLSERLRNEELTFSNIINGKNDTKSIRETVKKEITAKTLIISSDEIIKKALKNMDGVNILTVGKVNAKDLANCKKIIIDNKAVKILEKRLTNEK